MTKKLFILIGFLIAGLSLNAAVVPESVAAATGLNYWKSHARFAKVPNAMNASITKTYAISSNKQVAYYVFDITPTGFVIVSAEDAISPILGISYDGNYVPDNQAPAFVQWMSGYERVIEKARAEARTATAEVANAWATYSTAVPMIKAGTKAVAALVTTKWDQGTYYNYYCPLQPLGSSGKCVTGCVATSMAQLMKYWNYPESGFGSHSYVHTYFGTLSANYEHPYIWDSMTTYANTLSKYSISRLMYDCGVSVDMNYGPLESGTSSSLAVDALKNYWHYRSTITELSRADYTTYDWKVILRDQLDDGKPMLYSGSGSGGGHAWVCDGYQDSTFHMNWGWSGSNDGYYSVDDLTPGTNEFPDDQQVIINIIPDNQYYCVASKTLSEKSGTFGDGSGYSYYWNDTDCDWLIQVPGAVSINLVFTAFDTELDADVVEVYDGASTDSTKIGTYSGQTLPASITSSGDALLITFNSDAQNQYQ